MTKEELLVGIDVGGTNTDSVLLNPNKFEAENRGVIAFHKAPTTADVSDGISDALAELFKENKGYNIEDVVSITIGTTHFINAVIEQDKARLNKVGVIRLCGPYSKKLPPFSDFPSGLKNIIQCYDAYVNGGYRVDGNEIQSLDEKEIIRHAYAIKEAKIKAVAIVGIFPTVNSSQEKRAYDLLRSILPDADIVMSHAISGIGFLARENATILNASIMEFASKIIDSFIYSVRKSGFECPILLTQNDGTVLTLKEAIQTPIRTFSSGATNSMRGAAFLCSHDKEIAGASMAVVDIGGTTSDVGLLLPSGFPRQSSSHSEVGGVKMNFSMPHVESIGLGGGSIVRNEDDIITVGPDSVGSEISTRARVFGGSTITSSDVVVASEPTNSTLKIGDPSMVQGLFSNDFIDRFQEVVKIKLEKIIDRMRTSPDPLPVLLVGGGSFIAPLGLNGASKVLRPPYYQIANAIGAALGKLSEVVSEIKVLQSLQEKAGVINELVEQAKDKLVQKGALISSLDVIDISVQPVPYTEQTYLFSIKVVGDIDYKKIKLAVQNFENSMSMNDITKEFSKKTEEVHKDLALSQERISEIDFKTYKPTINDKRQWEISEIDADFIRIGTYILGCGGGGNPYPTYLELIHCLKEGAKVNVISIDDAHKYATNEGNFIPVGFGGSPTVSEEQLKGEEIEHACKTFSSYLRSKPDGILSVEIGGGNGLEGLCSGASTAMNLPVLDADLMGRAYPTLSQIIPCTIKDGVHLAPSAMSDSNGNDLLINSAQSDAYVEKILRAALSEVGASSGVVNNPMTTEELKSMTIHHSVSTAWKIGRSVRICRQNLELNKLPEYILDAVGGSGCGKILFHGKIIGVHKRLFKGHVYGEVEIENEQKDLMVIPFKNENIVAKVKSKNSKEFKVVCSVPDLISVCYSDTGEAVGTPDFKYGIMVFVLGFAPSDMWVKSEKALDIGGPKSFGPAFENVEYVPVGKYKHQTSVIDDYCP